MADLTVRDLSSPIGLIAGNGNFPLEFLTSARSHAIDVVVVAHKGETNPQIESLACHCTWIKVGEVKKMVRALKRQGVKQAAFTGGIKRVNLFKNVHFDLRALSLIARLGSIKDDIILRGIAGELESEGITIFSPGVLLDKSLARRGTLTRRVLSPQELTDAKVGWEAALAIGRLDIGQTVVVSGGVVVTVEAIEGTDQAIQRAGALTNGRGGTIVKLAKPQQDLRFDLPAVGVQTIHSMIDAKLSALVLQTERALILDPEKVVRLADEHNISVAVFDAL